MAVPPTGEPVGFPAKNFMTGRDVGSAGKRDELSNMSTIEQDIAEKHYHKDMDSHGFVDEPWHNIEHLAPLEERFAFAIQEAKELSAGSSHTRTVEREESIEIVRTRS